VEAAPGRVSDAIPPTDKAFQRDSGSRPGAGMPSSSLSTGAPGIA